MLQISNNGIDLIKRFEDCKPEAYRDSVGNPTIGYGHIHGVKKGDAITGPQADRYLREDLQVAEIAVNTNAKVNLTQNQDDALVSFVLNLGANNFFRSTLLNMLNKGDYDGAAAQFARWRIIPARAENTGHDSIFRVRRGTGRHKKPARWPG